MLSALHFHDTPHDIIVMGRAGSNIVWGPIKWKHLIGAIFFHYRSVLNEAVNDTFMWGEGSEFTTLMYFNVLASWLTLLFARA